MPAAHAATSAAKAMLIQKIGQPKGVDAAASANPRISERTGLGVTWKPHGFGTDWDQAVKSGPSGTRNQVERLKWVSRCCA